MAVTDDIKNEEVWELTVKDQLSAPIEKVWDIVSDFVKIDRWLPTMTSKLAEGEAQVPGAVRLVQGKGSSHYAYEKLVSLDSDNHSVVYDIEGNNVRLKDFRAELRLTQGSEPGTTLISWGYKMLPSSDISKEEVAAMIGYSYEFGIGHLKVLLQEPVVDGSLPEAGGKDKAVSELEETEEPLTGPTPLEEPPLKAEEPVLTSEVEKLSIAS